MSAEDFEGLVEQATPAPIPDGPRTVADVLDRGLAEHPDREIVIGASRRCSYTELDALANRAAHALAELGVSRGDRVAVSLPTDVDIVAFFHGALRLGAIWLGINRNLAPPEKRFILEDAGVALFLGDPEMTAQVEGLRGAGGLPDLVRSIVCDRDDPGCAWYAALERASEERPEVAIAPTDPAAIAYTSGTTGFPKGVVHSHHNLLVPGAGQKQAFGLGPDSRRALGFPLTILNVQILTSLLVAQHGGSCVLIDRVDARGIAEWIRRERITSFTGAPAQLYGLSHDPEIEVEWLASLERASFGGADCPRSILDDFAERFGVRAGGAYGLTEAPTAVAMDASGEERVEGATGRVLPPYEISIRDEQDRALPIGETGEVCIGPRSEGRWAGVWTPMLGYWKRPEETREALRGGCLHTGDLGHLDADDNLSIVDRKKLMIVRGGANVYPAEVERVLQQDGRVAACAVVGVADERLGERVAAWVEPAEGVDPCEALGDALRAHCAGHLARYKVPERIAFVAAMPRNAMNKIQRDRLPALELARPDRKEPAASRSRESRTRTPGSES